MKSCIHSTAGLRGRVHIVELALALLLMVGILSSAANRAQAQSGDVYTSTNSAFGNSVVMFHRATDGVLTPVGSFFTGGMGTGSGLGSAHAVIVGPSHKFLYTVDAGSSDIATFAIQSGGLRWVGNTPSGGTQPVSLTAYGHVLYALNAGGTDNISGFTINSNGSLTPLANSTQLLSGIGTGAAQIEFSPDGELLVVTEKTTNKIDVFAVDGNGVAGTPVITPSFGTEPYGFDFDPAGRIIVSEASAGAVSSYFVSTYGSLPITGSAPDGQAAPCWIAVSKTGAYAWTANAASGTVSAYSIAPNGRLTLFPGSGVAANLGGSSKPTDMAMDTQEKYLYVLEDGPGAVAAFRVDPDGTLTSLGVAGDLGPGMAGLAAR